MTTLLLVVLDVIWSLPLPSVEAVAAPAEPKPVAELTAVMIVAMVSVLARVMLAVTPASTTD
jgi:hypothetical protein